MATPADPKFQPRFIQTARLGDGTDVPVQGSRDATVRRDLAELAYEEYAAQGHGAQSFDRLHERGGFGALEMAMLLGDALLRERSKRGSDDPR